MEQYEIRELKWDEVKMLSFGDVVYALRVGTSVYEPAIVAKAPFPNAVHLVMAGEASAEDLTLTYSDYGNEYRLGVRDALCVKTPGGIIMVRDKQDDEYPGVLVEVYGDKKEANTLLAMVEHIPGGEGLCSYMPSDVSQMRKELNEVPRERIIDHSTGEIISKEEFAGLSVFSAAQSDCRYVASPGFVSRTWQDVNDEEAYNRTFHTGL